MPADGRITGILPHRQQAKKSPAPGEGNGTGHVKASLLSDHVLVDPDASFNISSPNARRCVRVSGNYHILKKSKSKIKTILDLKTIPRQFSGDFGIKTISPPLSSLTKVKTTFLNHFWLYFYQMNERELVTKAQAGDFQAFATLVNASKSRIYALALKMTANEQDAEDIVQETFLKAIDNIEQFRGESSFGTWLYSIALNQARAHLAKQKQTDLKPIEDYLPTKSADDLHRPDTHRLFDWKDPHQQLEDQELKEIIDAAIADLPVKYREAFLLRYYEELSIKEIAKLIKESVASTKSRVLRARLALRDVISKALEDRYGTQVS